MGSGLKKEIILHKVQVLRTETFWKTCTKSTDILSKISVQASKDKPINESYKEVPHSYDSPLEASDKQEVPAVLSHGVTQKSKVVLPAPGSIEVPLYKVAQCRTGDKGNDVNFSLIPHCPADLQRLISVVTSEWVEEIMKNLFTYLRKHHTSASSVAETGNFYFIKEKVPQDHMHVEIYKVEGIQALNIVVRNALDGGVNCSRRLDRHGKSLSDLILSQMISLPSESNY